MTDTKTEPKQINIDDMTVQDALRLLDNIRIHDKTLLPAAGHEAFKLALDKVMEFVEEVEGTESDKDTE